MSQPGSNANLSGLHTLPRKVTIEPGAALVPFFWSGQWPRGKWSQPGKLSACKEAECGEPWPAPSVTAASPGRERTAHCVSRQPGWQATLAGQFSRTQQGCVSRSHSPQLRCPWSRLPCGHPACHRRWVLDVFAVLGVDPDLTHAGQLLCH